MGRSSGIPSPHLTPRSPPPPQHPCPHQQPAGGSWVWVPWLGLLGTWGRGGWHPGTVGPQGAEGAECSTPGWQGLSAERHTPHFVSQTFCVWRQELRNPSPGGSQAIHQSWMKCYPPGTLSPGRGFPFSPLDPSSNFWPVWGGPEVGRYLTTLPSKRPLPALSLKKVPGPPARPAQSCPSSGPQEAQRFLPTGPAFRAVYRLPPWHRELLR